MVEKNKKYDIKVPYKIVDQIGLLKRLKLNLPNIKSLKLLLEDEAFQRYSPYIHHFKDHKTGELKEKSKFADLIFLKKKDKKLRMLLLDELEVIENCIKDKIFRTLINLDQVDLIIDLNLGQYQGKLQIIFKKDEAIIKSLENKVEFGELWNFINCLSFGNLCNFYISLEDEIKSKIIDNLNISNLISENNDLIILMKLFSKSRNHCAHYHSALNFNYKWEPRIANLLGLKKNQFHSIGPILYLINIFVFSIKSNVEEHLVWRNNVAKLILSVVEEKEISIALPHIFETTNFKFNNFNWNIGD